MIFSVITIIYARITMISERIIRSGEILVNSPEKSYKVGPKLVMIRPLQRVEAAMSDKVSEVQYNIAGDLIAIHGSVVIAPSILEMIWQILEMIRPIQYSPRVVQSAISGATNKMH